MQSIHWKLVLVVSALHAILFLSITQLALQAPDHGTQSVISARLVESKPIASASNKVTFSIAKRAIPKAEGTIHSPLTGDDGLSIVKDGSASEFMSSPITPPSADAYALRNPKALCAGTRGWKIYFNVLSPAHSFSLVFIRSFYAACLIQ
jgi:hypothetical protein